MLVARHPKLFSDPDERLTFTTKVVSEIRTKSYFPTYTRFYPYPMALKAKIETQIDKLLDLHVPHTTLLYGL